MIGSHDRIPYTDDESSIYNLFNYFNYPYINEEDIYTAPDWVSDTIWYQIFPERFCNGSPNDGRDLLPWGSDEMDGADKKFGGNLQGIIDKLDYIESAGFNGIYLTPIFESPSSHKYDTTDYFKIDPEFGDNETFGILVEEAHKRGIKVMLDAVFNHCGFYHPFWQDVLKYGKESKYFDCFYVLDPGKPLVQGEIEDGVPAQVYRDSLNYRTFAYTQAMPKWNTSNPIVREHLFDAACYWIENYHIDGWRLDVSNEVSHEFWRELRKKVKAAKSDIYILGENWDNSYPWLEGDQFDAVMNYEFAIPVWDYFRPAERMKPGYDVKEFRYAIGKLLTDYPKHVTRNLFNLLDSHDTERILNVAGGNEALAKLAYIFLFTYPGSPCVFYGGEIGMGGGEHSNRQCMIWEEEQQNTDMFSLIKRLSALRKQHESFRDVSFEWIDRESKADVVFYRKSSTNEMLYVILNKADVETNVLLPEDLKNSKVRECLSGDMIALESEICLDPFGYRLFLRQI